MSTIDRNQEINKRKVAKYDNAKTYDWVKYEVAKKKRAEYDYKVIKSKYDGKCIECSEVINKGDWITFDGKARHVRCHQEEVA